MNDSNTNSFNKSNDCYLFQQSPKATVRRLLKEISMHHYVKIAWNVNFKSLQLNKSKSISAMTTEIQKMSQLCYYQKMLQTILQKQYFP